MIEVAAPHIQQRMRRVNWLVHGIIACSFLIILLFTGYLFWNLRNLQAEKLKLDEQVQAHVSFDQLVAHEKDRQKELAAQLALFSKYFEQPNRAVFELLTDLSRTVPQDIILSQLEFNGTVFTIQGTSQTLDAVNLLVSRLQADYLIDFQHLEKTVLQTTGQTVYNFILSLHTRN